MGRGRAGVLVVCDHGATRMLLEGVLTPGGYAVRTAPDGAVGLVILREWRPDAIVLDVMMPGMDAPAFREGQRGLPGVADVPVLLLSATRADALETIARNLGVAAWLEKPFDLDALLAAVARLTDR
jgi:chemosensory pili system protein ChpA (sensor histidine kinase/response regulator)